MDRYQVMLAPLFRLMKETPLRLYEPVLLLTVEEPTDCVRVAVFEKDGAGVGTGLGFRVGRGDGRGEGLAVGLGDGEGEGEPGVGTVGSGVGMAVGLVGMLVGSAVGTSIEAPRVATNRQTKTNKTN
jgi:hypothetical protein